MRRKEGEGSLLPWKIHSTAGVEDRQNRVANGANLQSVMRIGWSLETCAVKLGAKADLYWEFWT